MRRNSKFRLLTSYLHTSAIMSVSSRPTVDPKSLKPPHVNLAIPVGTSPSRRGVLIRTYALELYKQYGISDWRFGYDSAKRRAGACHGSRKLITLSSFFATHNSAEEIQGTIVHEIAHALAPASEHHGPIWRAIAIAMGDSGDRCYDNKKVIMPKGRFVYECPGCKKEVHRHKRIGSSGTACGTCCRTHNGGRYDAKYKLVWKGTQSSMPTLPTPVAALKPSAPAPQIGSKSKTERMRDLYDAGTTSVGEIAKIVGAHYSHVHTVISKHKQSKS